jgi:rhodanese-related sulfurtransferase
LAPYPHTRLDPPQELVGRGIAWIALTGVLLGLGYNYLALQGPPPHRGLPWISRPIALTDLESVNATAPVSPATTPAPQAAAPAMAQPATPPPTPVPSVSPKETPASASPAPAAASSALDVPDIGRPLQVQLPKVKEFWDAKAALIIDAREPAEYAAGHIPGAISLPHDETVGDPGRLDAVDSGGRPIICYCGGGSCEVSIHMAEALVYQAGKKRVLVFMGGWPEWEAAGYPVEK